MPAPDLETTWTAHADPESILLWKRTDMAPNSANSACLAALALACSTNQQMEPAVDPSSQLLYVGTYTRESSAGIYAYRFFPDRAAVEPIGMAAEMSNPSFLALHPDGAYLYAVSETDDFDSRGSGSVAAFELDPASGSISKINEVSSGGGWPCHLGIDPSGRMLIVANYKDGTVASFPVQGDGALGNATSLFQHEGRSVHERQRGPHAHSADFSPDGRFAFFSDLGLDQVRLYTADPETATLAPNDPNHVSLEPGSGPRHFAQHPSGRFGYVVNELGSTVSAFDLDGKTGSLEALQTLTTLPEGFTGENYTAEIHAHPSGRFVYASNRGHDSIAVFAVDQQTGRLGSLGQVPTNGDWPRNFSFDRTGRYLLVANQNSDNVVVFEIDGETGLPVPTGNEFAIDAPVCLVFR